MPRATCKLPYPQNLMCDIFGEEISMDRLPADFEESLDYVLENLMHQSESFILVLRYLHGMTYREIGDYFGLTYDRTRQIIERAQRKLRHPSRSRCLMRGLAQIHSLPNPRKDRPPLGMVLDNISFPDLELPAKRRKYCQIQLAAGNEPYPALTLNGCPVQAGTMLRVLLVDGWSNITLGVRPEATGPDRWYISTSEYSRISPIGLFAEI